MRKRFFLIFGGPLSSLFLFTLLSGGLFCSKANAGAEEPPQFAWASDSSVNLSNPEGIAVDGSGNVYVVDWGNDCIQKLSSTGDFIIKWGSKGSGDGEFDCPYGIAADSSGNIYVTDAGNSRIQKFNSTGAFIDKWGKAGTGDGEFSIPYGIAVDSNCNVYVVDFGNDRIQKFSSTGDFIIQWGRKGTGNGEFDQPEGIAVDSNGNIYVADQGNNRIQKFSLTRDFIIQWGSYGSGDGEFDHPEGIAVDSNDNIYVAAWGNNRIQKFSSTGAFITKWGSYGSGDGQFISPDGIAVDGSGNIYVADFGNDRIQKFTYKVAKPSIFPPSCSLTADDLMRVSIGCATIDATIHYTMDGSEPTESSPIYGPILTLNFFIVPVTMKAKGFKSGWTPSDTATETYTRAEESYPVISVSPASYNFGNVNVDVTKDQTVTITNAGNADLILENLAITGTNAGEFSIQGEACSGTTIAPEEECAVTVQFSPTAAGAKSATLVIPSNDPNTAKNPLNVSLIGTGVILEQIVISGTPAKAYVGAAYSFTPTVSGGVAPLTFTLTNAPTWLTIKSITGTLGGTPNATGTTAGVLITVTDAATTPHTATLTFNLTVAMAAPIPDTGQTQSYTNTVGEDADYTINPPSYTKLDAQGNVLSASASSWSMVKDNVTGLIWEGKTNDESIHDKDNTYNWDDAQNVFIANLNAANYGGFSDWRLPTIKELSSMVNSGTYEPAINTAYFPNTMSSNYWSFTTNVIYTYNAWCVNFGYGVVQVLNKSSIYDVGAYVRAVRGGQSVSLGDLVINAGGTVTDTSTELMWQRETAGDMTWEEAISYCEGLSLGGHNDWRLPNRNELQSLPDYTCFEHAIDTAVFPGTMSSSYYWSSTTYASDSNNAWCVWFADGSVRDDVKSGSHYVRAVRNGQSVPLNNSVIVSPTTGLTTTESGGTAVFTIVLSTKPTADVSIGISSSDLTEGTVLPASISFTPGNWNAPQTVTIKGVDDSVDDGDIAYTIITAAALSDDANYNGLNPADVSVTNADNDIADKVATPSLSPSTSFTDSTTVSISCATSGATIHYTTDGSVPTETSPLYTPPLTLTATTTIKAKGFKSGWTPSDTAIGVYTRQSASADKVATPSLSPLSTSFTDSITVLISCATDGATIRYTTDRSEPTETSLSLDGYTGLSLTATFTIKAKGFKSGWTPSDTATGTYTKQAASAGKVATPSLPASTSFTNSTTVLIDCATDSATIHYTTDESEPMETSPLYTPPLTLTATTTIKARGFKSGWTPSDTATETYTYIQIPFGGDSGGGGGGGGGCFITTLVRCLNRHCSH